MKLFFSKLFENQPPPSHGITYNQYKEEKVTVKKA
jgi:hypothetical protein